MTPPAPSFRVTAAVLALLILHAVLASFGLQRVGPTNDETAHLTAGYAYGKFNDYRLQPENGNLPQRWGALPLQFVQPHLDPAEHPELWRESEVWLIADTFLFGGRNGPDRLFHLARLSMLFWPLATGVLIFCWARSLWGDGGGLLSLSLYILSPTVLAHGPLVTSDATAAFWLLAASGAFWSALNHGGRWIVLSVLATGLAFVSKFSCVLLIPTFILLGGWHLATATGSARIRWRLAGRFGAILGCNALGAFLAIWLFFSFRFEAAGPGMPALDQFMLPWSEILPSSGPIASTIQAARSMHLLPEAYIQGFSFVRYFSEARGAFLAGAYSTTGWWWFFPATFIWKSTVVELLATVALLTLCFERLIRRRPRVSAGLRRLAPLLALGLVYGGFSLTSHLNIGQRHILPLYLILFVSTGALVHVTRPARRYGWAALPIAALFPVIAIAPHYLTYFNLPSGGAQNGWRKLVDSSLDWGQGLPDLAAWVAEHRQPDERLYVSYFGSDSLAYRLPDATPLAPIYDHFRPRRFEELQPGLYCIGATMLQDAYSPVNGPWDDDKEASYRRGMAWARGRLEAGTLDNRIVDFGRDDTEALWQIDRLRFARLMRYLRVRPADAIVANCVLVFRLNALELQAMIEGPPEVVELMLQSAAAGQIPGRD